jgi:uncharacterized protein (TIGR03067 family)
MVRKLLGAAFVLCVLAWTCQAADDKKSDKDNLQGTWVHILSEQGGLKAKPLKGLMDPLLTFKGDTFTMTDHQGEKEGEGTFKLDENKKPKEIDLVVPKQDNPKETETVKGIYQLDGDTLKLAHPTTPGGPRPTSFDPSDSKEVVVNTFKRKK